MRGREQNTVKRMCWSSRRRNGEEGWSPFTIQKAWIFEVAFTFAAECRRRFEAQCLATADRPAGRCRLRFMAQAPGRGSEVIHLIGAGVLLLLPRLSGSEPLKDHFHDIKPPPSFLPIPWGVIGVSLLILLVALLFARRIARGKRKSRSSIPLPPDEEAMLALRRLGEAHVSGAEVGEALAEILRTFYRRAIGIRADEQTFLELERAVGAVVQRNLPLVPKELREQEGRRLKAVLRSVERLEFAPDGGEVEGARAREVVKEHISTLALWIKSEGARTQSVTESSPSVFPLLREVL